MFGHVNIFIQNIARFFFCISSLCIINFILIGGNQRSTKEKKGQEAGVITIHF